MTVYPGPGESEFAGNEADRWTPEQLPPLPGDEWMHAMEPTEHVGPPSGPSSPDPVGSSDQGSEAADEIPPSLQLAFAPLHKRAFGMAVGFACALLIGAVTLFHLLLDPRGPNLGLLSQYFYGYTVSWTGLLIGMGWGFVVGFVAGWFFAFCRNLALAASIFINRTRAELAQTRDFLDHI